MQEETDSEAESLEKRNEEKDKSKVPSAAGTKPPSPSAATDAKQASIPTPGVSPPQKKLKKDNKDRGGTSTPKANRHSKKDSAAGSLTPSKAPSSRRPSPKPPSRQSSPKPPANAGGSRAGSPLAATPVTASPETPTAMQGLEGPSATTITGPPNIPSKSLIVRFHISPAGRKRLREEEGQLTTGIKRIKFNLKSGGKSLSPSPPPEERRPSIPTVEPSRTASPDDYLITEDEIVALVRGERLTTKQLLARLKGKLKRNENNKAILGELLKKRCKIVEGFLVLKD